MAASPGKKRRIDLVFWMRMNQVLNFLLSLLLGATAYLQIHRDDAVVWVSIFLVPAIITFISAIKIHVGASPEVKVVSTIHVSCCLCLLVYLGIRLVHGMANQNSTIIMYEGNDIAGNSYNPLSYQEGWEIVAVILVVAWMKYFAIACREQLREAGIKSTEVSPVWMLKAMAVVVVVPLGLACFCYIEGVKGVTKVFYGVLESNPEPIPPIYDTVAKPTNDVEH